jgi:hypothetical protein
VLTAVGGATSLSVVDLSTRFGGGRGPPQLVCRPSIPMLSLHDIGPLCTAALAIAVVSFADTSVLSRV